MTASWAYVRFHRGAQGSGASTPPASSTRWRRRIAAWRRKTDVFAYFNNDWEGFAPKNAQELSRSFS